MSYHSTIASLHHLHPTIPAVLANVDLNRQHTAGTPVTREHVQHAKAVVDTLRGIREAGQDATVTTEIVMDADMRRVAIEQAYSSARYAPANVQQALGDTQQTLANIQGTLANLQRAVDVIIDGQRINQAVTANNRIVSRNSRLQQPNPYSPLQKTVPGSGHVLANAVRPANLAVITAMNPAPGIGSLPAAFNGQIATYSNADILRLIAFYNEDFGILPGDSLTVRVAKFRAYISEF